MAARIAAEVTTIGINIGKNGFHLVGLDARGHDHRSLRP